MQQITLSEYNNLHPDRRSIWTTERDDMPNWAEDRHKYMGKRTMMSGDGTCTLLIEGLSFEIVNYHRYLIFAGHHAAMIDIPHGLHSDGYGMLQDWFAKKTRGDSFSSMRKLDSQINGVWYRDELAGPDGASFELYSFPDTTAAVVEKAERSIRRQFDVVSLKVRYFKKLHEVQSHVVDILKTV